MIFGGVLILAAIVCAIIVCSEWRVKSDEQIRREIDEDWAEQQRRGR